MSSQHGQRNENNQPTGDLIKGLVLNKGFGTKSLEDYWLQRTPEEGWRVQQTKQCDYNNQDEDTMLWNLFQFLIQSARPNCNQYACIKTNFESNYFLYSKY